jgi:hypothetical protein
MHRRRPGGGNTVALTSAADQADRTAAAWLDRAYGGLVTLAGDQPVLETERSWLVACAYADDRAEPLLATTLAVPKDGGEPFPVANAAPLDESLNVPDGWQWRVNARGCLVATDAAVDNQPASALPWRPADEAPGWWDRLLGRHFPGAEVSACTTWAEVTSAIVDGGPGTRGAVWLRRHVAGAELTGHLLYACHAEGAAVVIDGQTGTPAHLDDNEVGGLVLARFHRDPPEAAAVLPHLAAAPDLTAAVAKATAWLAAVHGDAVVLVDPAEEDETARGWLFACTTRRYLVTSDWRDLLLDAALVVPKEAGQAPFGLPNSDPWPWLRAWDAGEQGLPEPPDPGPPDWFQPTVQSLGVVRKSTTHTHWGEALATLATLPTGARALVWLRRKDGRGRETVGNLLVAVKDGEEVRLVDSQAQTWSPHEPNPLAVHVVVVG